MFVIIYSAVYFILKLKYSWWKFMKLVLLFSIVRIKYSMHYGTRVSLREIHFVMDRYSRYFNLRRYYQILYLRLALLGGAEVTSDGQLFFWVIFMCIVLLAYLFLYYDQILLSLRYLIDFCIVIRSDLFCGLYITPIYI